MKPNILLLGNTGQVGWELHRALNPLGELIALDYPRINMADPKSIRAMFENQHPEIIINATAYTNVDQAGLEPDLAMAINGTGVAHLAELAKKHNTALIHYSTDYVFDGTKGEPYTETDLPNPINVYGKTKLAGEKAIQEIGGNYMIFRTSWVYSLRRPCFVTKVLSWAQKNETLRIVDDQISNPTWARSLAEVTAQIIAQGKSVPTGYIKDNAGLYHLAGEGICSRYEWASEIIAHKNITEQQKNTRLDRGKSIDFPVSEMRPHMTALNCEKFISTFNIKLPNWKSSLRLAMQT